MKHSQKDRSPESGLYAMEKRLKPTRRHLLSKVLAHGSLRLTRILFRILELLLTLTLALLFALPLSMILLLRKLVTGKSVTLPAARTIIGQGGKKLSLTLFNTQWPTAANLALLFYVLTGKLGLAGSSMEDFSNYRFVPESSYLHTGKPGIVSLWTVRKNANIGHEGNVAAEWEYRFTRTPLSDLFLILRAIPAYFFQSSHTPTEKQINLFDIHFVNTTMRQAVTLIHTMITGGGGTKSIFFVNPDCLNKTFSDRDYHEILQNADQVFPDGIGLTVACKILGTPLLENVNGTDMLPFLCEMAAEKQHSLFLLGGEPGVAEKMAENLKVKYQVHISGTQHGFFDHQQDNDKVIQAINTSGADIVLVAFGAPLQEKWIAANGHKLECGVAIGVGGLFDFYSDKTKRAPRWLREIGLEWVYRILQEPGRMWKRYVVGNPLFLLRVVMWKIRQPRNA